MKKQAVKALSLVLCVLLCVSLLPLTALAAPADVGTGPSVHTQARLAASRNDTVRITKQPKSQSVKQGNKVTMKVSASGSGLKYQWYYRKSASASWTVYKGKTKPTLTFTAGRVNGYQYRCKVYNMYSRAYSKAATLKVNYVEYRAFLVGQDYQGVTGLTELAGSSDVEYMRSMLSSAKGAMGGKYKIYSGTDMSYQEIYRGIQGAFEAADSNDVSLFYFSGHGVSDLEDSEYYAGGLCTVEGNDYDLVALNDLAWWLRGVEGKVIVMIDSCGSGAAIYKNGGPAVSMNASAARFNTDVIRAFAAVDQAMPGDGAAANAGDFRKSKFYVLTASQHMENSNVVELTDGTLVSLFTFLAAVGVRDYFSEVDANRNKYITLDELYKFIQANEEADIFGQHVQVYPAGSSYKLFKK